ncbi:GroES-like protein [Xylariaceae sp. FL0804]|nr:GroES-like protein [Xylariaceae sp. FL0804]
MAPSAALEDTAPMQLPVSSGHPRKIDASVLHGPGDLRLEARTLEAPGVGELQIAVVSTGICGSDVAYYKKFANGDLCACAPLSLGHESSGTVVAIGARVDGFSLGDRVALEVGVPCGHCGICNRGRYNLCKKMRFRSSAKSVPHFQGTLQERINHPAKWCHKLPDNISFEAAALLEPLSVAIHAVNRASPAPGSTALVMGAGTVGLLTAAMARQSGCSCVTIADLDAGRVDYAVQHGFATHGHVVPHELHTVSSSSSLYADAADSDTASSSGRLSGSATPASVYSDASSSIHERFETAKGLASDLLALQPPPPRPPPPPGSDSSSSGEDEEKEYEEDGDNYDDDEASHGGGGDDDDDDEAGREDAGVDVAFECTGKEKCMHTSLYATKPGGKVVMVGMGTPVQTLPLSVAHLREVDILGIFRYANTYATGIQLLSSGSSGSGPGSGSDAHHPTTTTTNTTTMTKGPALPSLDDMVTHRFKGLRHARDAFELAARTIDDGGNLVLKVVIEA